MLREHKKNKKQKITNGGLHTDVALPRHLKKYIRKHTHWTWTLPSIGVKLVAEQTKSL